MLRKNLRVIAATLIAGVVVSGSALAQVKIGLILPMTGPQSSTGKQISAAAKLYMQQHGDTVAGKKIELIIKDDGAVPDNTKRIAQELIVNDKVSFLAGFGVTAGLDRAGEVNLEKSLAFGDKLGGHLVTGHVDGIGIVLRRLNYLLQVKVPKALSRYVARKGSICINGVSLTVNRVRGDTFEVNLIPHTLKVTTLRCLARGSKVNLEVDLVARYVARLLDARG